MTHPAPVPAADRATPAEKTRGEQLAEDFYSLAPRYRTKERLADFVDVRYDDDHASLVAENQRLREALKWAMEQIPKPERRIIGQNERYFVKYQRAEALLKGGN